MSSGGRSAAPPDRADSSCFSRQVRLLIYPNDAAKAQMASRGVSDGGRSRHPVTPARDGEEIRLGADHASTLAIRVMETPGHTPGSTSFLVGRRHLLSGRHGLRCWYRPPRPWRSRR